MDPVSDQDRRIEKLTWEISADLLTRAVVASSEPGVLRGPEVCRDISAIAVLSVRR